MLDTDFNLYSILHYPSKRGVNESTGMLERKRGRETNDILRNV
jgi:hypothetical protein